MVTQLMGAKTYSEAVNRALDESIRLCQIRGLAKYMGTGVWEGDLSVAMPFREAQKPLEVKYVPDAPRVHAKILR